MESDVLVFTKDNPCILEPETGCTSGVTVTTHECVDMAELMSTPVEEIVDGVDLLNQLIDVKTRKTLRGYPLVELLYHRYVNSQEHCGVKSNALSTESVEVFVDLVASFWTEIIEQVVPATTIWGSSLQHSNSVFGSDKYAYKRSTLNLCTPLNFEAPSPTSGINNNVDVITVDVTDDMQLNTPKECSGAYIIQTNDGSEFLGTVTIVGPDGGNTTGSTITINETITDDCNKFETCEPSGETIGDWLTGDWDDDDWFTGS